MASANARRAAAVLRARTRTNRAAATERRAIAIAARRVRTGARSLATHIIATGTNPDTATIKAVSAGLRNAAKKVGIKVKGRRVRVRRSLTGPRNIVKVVYRYTRAQVAQLAAAYKPRKAECKALRAALLAV